MFAFIALPGAVTCSFRSRFSFQLVPLYLAMDRVNLVALADRYNSLIDSLRAIHRALVRGRVARGIEMLADELDGVLSDDDGTDSDSATETAPGPAGPVNMPAFGWMLQWYEQLPDGPCRRAVNVVRDLRLETGADADRALQCAFGYAQQHFPEEIVLWTLAGGVVPDPWHTASVQEGMRSSLLALRNLRAGAAVPAALQPFSGVGHQLN